MKAVVATMKLVILFILVAVPYACCKHVNLKTRKRDECTELLSEELIAEIASYENEKNDIFKYVLEGNFKGKTYDELAKFVDKFGARPSGTQVLEDSIDYMIKLSEDENLNVTTESVEVPHWVRGEETATMLKPRVKNIKILGLGQSVNTPSDGITAEVVIVNDWNHLDNLRNNDVEGKIVLYIPKFTTYSKTVEYRTTGAARAAAKGAVASLVRSITPFSIYTPHTGAQTYSDDAKKIPTAAITLEDADMITRISNRGEKVVLNIKMTSVSDTKISRNTIVELEGKCYPEKRIIVSGHIDSWDVGQGAMDDGGGMFISWAAPVILKQLKLIPKRSIQAIFWTAEEPGLYGAKAYKEKHMHELDHIGFIMESDEGTFAPRGLEVVASPKTRCIVSEVLKMFSSINASSVLASSKAGSDIQEIIQAGVPGAGLLNDNDKYFWYHHTEADTMNVESSEELDLGTAFWTTVAYIIADLSEDMPR